ncbi:MAG: DnaD domain protein [Caldilineaceae bacterium]
MLHTATGFVGFPDQKMKPVVIPDYFFTDLLAQIDHLAELKVTLHCFWLLNEQQGEFRYLRGDDLRQDEILLQSLSHESELRTPLTMLEDALQRAVARNTLLRLEIEKPDAEDDSVTHQGAESAPNEADKLEDWYFMNTVKGRQTIALVRQGKLRELQSALPAEARLRVERPNIFVLYEQNIGLMTPLIAEQLRDLEKSYPPDWIDEAFEIAVSRNKRALRYIQAILKRWETEGKNDEQIQATGRDAEIHRRNRYIPDEYADIILG